MRILFVQDSLGTGGAERSNAYLWYYLREQKVDFSIVVLEHRKEGIEAEILREGFHVTFLKSGNFIQNSLEIVSIIKAYKPTIVHSVLLKSNLRVRLAKAFTPFYHVESLVNCTYDPVRLKDPKTSKPAFYAYKIIDYLSAIKGVNHSVAITEEVEKHYRSHLKFPDKRLSVIYRGRNPNVHVVARTKHRKALRHELGLSSEKMILIHVGRQEYQKGHMHLLNAIHKISSKDVSVLNQIAVVFCGRKGNASPEIEEFLKAYPEVQAKTFWLGHRLDVPALLVGADAFVFPSLYEGLGGSLIEAQAAALPVICSDLPVFHEVVIKNENALMFPVGDDDKLAEQIITLTKGAELRKKMGNESLENFNRKFKLDKINEDTLSFYREVSA
ncbi:glycosyltransferase family 4 protein [Pontibacter anaerobius]|uniref:Glycosyltransferase family 4 protein n=1 Tax=Pontibacter anaerobius TaxID=2993940 RepID=A0ABT3REW4_9BACT|nr:glycosyltransferase family 4 protein [Pontibacter anaerobius]MCX2739959.1 glycosyltransferase family 4 protein [Pontibacter anaerobius]